VGCLVDDRETVLPERVISGVLAQPSCPQLHSLRVSLHETWEEISLSPPSAYRSRELVAAADTAAVAVDTERSRGLAPSIAALYFDTAQGAAELVPVLSVVFGLIKALDRSPNTGFDDEPRTRLEHAWVVATQLANQLRADIDQDPQALASAESRQLAARVAIELLEVHRLQPSVESFHFYGVVAMAVYSLLVPSA